jgi:CBS domain-containing protein
LSKSTIFIENTGFSLLCACFLIKTLPEYDDSILISGNRTMAVKIKDLMTKDVTTAQPHHTVGHIKEKMAKRSVNSIPVVSTDHAAVGVVSASDLIAARKEGTPISNIMADNVYTIPEYEDVSVAARMMRNHKIHHLVVTNEQKVVGIISSFDLLTLVEDHRFVMKNAPTPNHKSTGKRAKAELK